MASVKVIRARRCVDCAFHPQSPESAPYSGGIAAEGGSVIDLLHTRIREEGDAALPFFCHEGVPTVPNNGWRAVAPGIGEQARKLRVCAGFAAAFAKINGRPYRI